MSAQLLQDGALGSNRSLTRGPRYGGARRRDRARLVEGDRANLGSHGTRQGGRTMPPDSTPFVVCVVYILSPTVQQSEAVESETLGAQGEAEVPTRTRSTSEPGTQGEG